MAACYSDHNEDVRLKGSCDYCNGTEYDVEGRALQLLRGWLDLTDFPEGSDVWVVRETRQLLARTVI